MPTSGDGQPTLCPCGSQSATSPMFGSEWTCSSCGRPVTLPPMESPAGYCTIRFRPAPETRWPQALSGKFP